FGCCHEVFGTKGLVARMLKEHRGLTVKRDELVSNVIGVNHFTWLTDLTLRGEDLFPFYAEAIEKQEAKLNEELALVDNNWVKIAGSTHDRVKYDLFKRYGVMAAAGDRHLAEFCEGSWYLESPEMVQKWGYSLTTVKWRKEDLEKRLARSARLQSGEEAVKISNTGEEGVKQMRALLGLCDLVTNVNLPNVGQIPNLPMGAVVETNATFTMGGVRPVMAGPVPPQILNLIARISAEQQMVLEGAFEHDLDKVFAAFCNDPLVRLPLPEARKMFDEMIENTKEYLTEYFE
ncbi:MAG: alpha-glucosidase/alpha-galactosidase, partial [Clostridia bacterium]|nr:alpha-glucosidase/alpha-galactosidase [Clostridia bacterium]